MKKITAMFMAAALLLTGCATGGNSKVPSDKVEIMVPSGAPALSLLSVYDNKHVKVTVVQGSDAITAELAKETSNYDIIIAPINLGTKMIAEEKTPFLLDSVLTWGNLYMVGTNEEALQGEGDFASFGEKAVPEMILKNTGVLEGSTLKTVNYNAVSDVQAQLLSGKANAGLLAEPAATATIAKAKEKGIELQVIKDLQAEFKNKNEMEHDGYPQAAIFVKRGRVKSADYAITRIQKFVNKTAVKDPKQIAKLAKKVGVKKLGIPNEQIAQKTWKAQNISLVKAKDVEKDIKKFLKLFKIDYTSEMLIR